LVYDDDINLPALCTVLIDLHYPNAHNGLAWRRGRAQFKRSAEWDFGCVSKIAPPTSTFRSRFSQLTLFSRSPHPIFSSLPLPSITDG
jgi:hypothetical protein